MIDYNNPNIKNKNNLNTKNIFLIKLICLAIILAFIVITLGAYTRLTDAGLGCPDWPGCYGRIFIDNNTLVNNADFKPVKAWTEMVHRYLAGGLGIIIFIISILTIYNNLYYKKYKIKHYILPVIILFTLIFQALLGMWTVTLKLLPTVVMGHLLGGFTTIILLVLILLTNFNFASKINFNLFSKLIIFLTFIILTLQITLGGWTSSNYAAIPCIDFPTCNGQFLPAPDTMKALNPLFKINNINYEGGILNNPMRVTIQIIHRWGALIFSLFLILTTIILKKTKNKYYNHFANWLLLLLITQISLGIINIKYALPLITAVLHNSIACLLLISLVILNYKINYKIKNF